MLNDLLLFLIIMAGGLYGLWLMRGVDGFVKRERAEKASAGGKVISYIRLMPPKKKGAA